MKKQLFYRVVKMGNPIMYTKWFDGIKSISIARKKAINLGSRSYIYQYYDDKQGNMVFTGKKLAVILCKNFLKFKIVNKTSYFKFVEKYCINHKVI